MPRSSARRLAGGPENGKTARLGGIRFGWLRMTGAAGIDGAAPDAPDRERNVRSYRIGIDIGGTFTDIVVVDDCGLMRVRKVPSTPDDYSRGIADDLERLFSELGISGHQVTGIVHATTVATNTILECKGARTGLLTTAGFRDVLELRRLRIPVLYDLQYEKPKPLAARRHRLEVRERMGPDGVARQPLAPDDVVEAAHFFRGEGIEAVAISFLHAYANPQHEQEAERLLKDLLGPAVYVCCGSEILPEIREYERTSTAVVNAYVGPIVASYANSLRHRLAAIGVTAPIDMMHSSGGIMRLDRAVRRAAALVESGPAAGVVACARLVRGNSTRANVISFDMGGTTAKAALVENGEPARTAEYEVGAGINLSSKLVKGGGYPIKMPFIDVSEIGAGGGSLIRLDRNGHVKVGPESAGSMPGPVCYGFGGKHVTLTDAFVTLGYINDEAIAGGTIRIDVEAGRSALDKQIARPLGQSLDAAARGVLALAVSTMTRAVKAVSTYRGRDPRDFTLVAFGGNGPVVAADIALSLGMSRVLFPAAAGVFSGMGLLRSDIEQDFVQPIMEIADEISTARLVTAMEALRTRGMASLASDGYATDKAEFRFVADLRYLGQAYELQAPLDTDAPLLPELSEAFHREHEKTYGHRSSRDPVQLVNIRLTVSSPAASDIRRQVEPAPMQRKSRHVVFEADRRGDRVDVIARADLDGSFRAGPLVVEEYDCTGVVPPGCAARVDETGNIEIRVGA